MSKTITLYVASQKVWGADYPINFYFETIQERNAFVKRTDYSAKAGTVKLTPTQYDDWKKYGDWDRYDDRG